MKIFNLKNHYRALSQLQKRFTHNERGMAFIEFGLVLPIIVLLFFGIIELSRYVQMNQKVDNASHALVDMVNQNFNITCEDIQLLMTTVPRMLKPFDSDGVSIIVNSIMVEKGTDEPNTKWQISSTGSTAISKISAGKDTVPTLPESLDLQEQDQIITAELFLNYRPLFFNNDAFNTIMSLDEGAVYRMNLARPRYGAFEFEPKC